MDRLRELQVFVAVADAGSFAKAGKRLRISPPAVTRAISSLEDRLGVRLINRTTRSLALTESGLRFLESTRRLLAGLHEAEQAARGSTLSPTGHLTVTASVMFGRVALASIIGEFLKAQPGITASLVLIDRTVNMVEEGVDVGVRIGHLRNSSLIARRIGEVRRILVASPDYLAARGEPEHPSELKGHSFVGFTGLMPGRELPMQVNGRSAQVAVQPRLEVNDVAAAIGSVEAGYGITTVLCYMVGDSMRAGRTRPVLKDFWPPSMPVHIVYPEARLLAPKVRAFVDWAAPRLAVELARLSA